MSMRIGTNGTALYLPYRALSLTRGRQGYDAVVVLTMLELRLMKVLLVAHQGDEQWKCDTGGIPRRQDDPAESDGIGRFPFQ